MMMDKHGILSIISNCCTNFILVFGAVNLEQTVIHVMSPLRARKRIIIRTTTVTVTYKANQGKKGLSLREANQRDYLKG